MSSALCCKGLSRLALGKSLAMDKLAFSSLLAKINKPTAQSLASLSSSASATDCPASRVKPLLTNFNGNCRLQVAFISTSNKKPDGTSITSDVTASAEAKTETSTATSSTKKYWRSYGFSIDSEEEDRTITNGVFFFTVTVGLVGISFILAYYPDVRYKDWGQREAYIELARREALGLPLVDPDLVPAEKFELPSEEELGDFEIII